MPLNMPARLREYMSLERQRTSDEGIGIDEYQRWSQLKRMLNSHFQPGVQDSHADRRESVRVPARLRVGFDSLGEMRESLMTNVSRGGLFISTPHPLPIGVRLSLRVHIEETGEVIDLSGEVASLNSGPGLMTEELGMGIKFDQLGEAEGKAVDSLYERSLRKALED
jgi:type IV pilus assembly protein PilZ